MNNEQRLNQAEQNAAMALNKIDSHERVCAERYANINTTQAQIQSALTVMQTSLNNVVAKSNESKGMWKAIGIMSGVMAITLAAIKLGSIL